MGVRGQAECLEGRQRRAGAGLSAVKRTRGNRGSWARSAEGPMYRTKWGAGAVLLPTMEVRKASRLRR